MAYTVYGASAILDAKVRKIFEIETLLHKNTHYLMILTDNRLIWAFQRYSVTVPKSIVGSPKLALYLYINIEVFLGYVKAFREL